MNITPSIRRYAGRSATVLLCGLCLALAGCGSSGGSSSGAGSVANRSSPEDYPGSKNVVPPSPAFGAERTGASYSIYIKGPVTGDKIAITVFEPSKITGGQSYPLILHSHGFGGTRDTPSSNGSVAAYLAKGYGAISIDERGHGESTGTIRVMDPDAEGQNLIAVLDWAETHLPWLRYGLSADGSDAHNLVLGSMGGSYGGMYQFIIHNIDPKHRLDAMTPEIAPNNLNFSLFPGTVPKTIWDVALYGAGSGAGVQGRTAANFDPFITNNYPGGILAGVESQGFSDFFYYHSNEYFCGSGKTVATNGGDGTKPLQAPQQGSKVNVMFYQGIRDTLFNLTDGINNYECALKQGGDVRFLSYQSGHNTLMAVPDPGLAFLPPDNVTDNRCGSLSVDDARMAFFEEHLKGVSHAADIIPTKPCLSLQKGSAVLVNHILHASSSEGTSVTVPATQVLSGLADVPIAIGLGITGADQGTLVAGVPHLKLSITPVNASLPGAPTVFVGLGRTHNGVPGVYDLIDNMVLPIHGVGEHEVDMIAIAAKLAKGDTLALLVYGLQDQFAVTGLTANQFPVIPVSVEGTLRLPLPAVGTYVDAP